MMLLKNLFENIDEKLDKKWESIQIRNIQYDSRKIEKGDLFTAVKGFNVDGHTFLQQVEEKGAVAAVVEKVYPGRKIIQIPVADSRKVMAQLAYNYYKADLEELDLIGITGTNGKTTCSYLIQSMLQTAGISCGLAGTIQYIIGNDKIDAWNTTPEAIDLYAMLSNMKHKENKACVLEVSSHALALSRVGGLKFKAAIFTNLSRDHMDFHNSMEQYFSDKKKLFTQLITDGTAVYNNDDPYTRKIQVSLKKLAFGMNNTADIYPQNWQTGFSGTQTQISTPQGVLEINSSLIGEFNMYNILTAVATGLAMNLPLRKIKTGIENLKNVPGRLEKYLLKTGVMAIIDYAHTPDALEKALKAISKIAKKRVICVFGCGGDRDKGKRPLMGQIAQKWSNIVFVTDDNPRTENSMDIIKDILEGMNRDQDVHIVQDRREAIAEALNYADKDDIVLIAGKGHETYQVIGKEKFNFNESEIIREINNA